MTEPFDWSVVTRAAEWWMEAHDTAPRYLLLPAWTTEEIAELAMDIYDVPVRRVNVPLPRFDDEIETLPESPVPLASPGAERFHQQRRAALVEAAQQGLLTSDDIKRMSMDDYAAVRGILLDRVREATKNKSFGEVWHSLKESD